MNCRICNNKYLVEFCQLGTQPLANSFIKKENLSKKEKAFPLNLCLCQQCGMVQLSDVVPAKLMFKNYLYIPSASKTRIQHFNELATTLKNKLNLNEHDLAVDIGSNDGSLLEVFAQLEVKILGIDPSVNLAKVAELKGIATVNDYFTQKTANSVVKKYGKAKAITATNVFAHVDDIHGFIKGIEILLADAGIFVIEFPYLVDFIENCEFDTVYHEHLSYFGVRTLVKLFENTPLEIFSIQRMNLDGGSLRVFVQKKKKNSKLYPEVENLIKMELKHKFDTLTPYRTFAKNVKERKNTFLKLLSELKKKKRKIVGYGAPAKGNTFLNYCKITTKDIWYIVDSTPFKQGLFLPGTHIPIHHEGKLFSDIPDYIVILAWNFAEEIIKKNAALRKKGVKFILPHQNFKII
ncbi:MAG: hypothetical protein A3H79_03270 [Candidatus Levybacteria bacterium RIFCSPLOWO2_02_FULL_36_8b]|nr:MAG: hypothetical protein A3H79_03270 [Candidatus Levybacteria bacterium RIFCSPLOWO2_02_FULL_36_8b]